ncbi:3-hydroxyacyl-CoA dehydrogenase family protein [Candidatus Bathyarchaeota archaeon]|nr:3-hydroxyacyl-CoA dehydrogenase family protein [Candidatus Bathyarchaeota archaeon]
MAPIERVCVVGAGYLGTQIGVTCARHGYAVYMQDVSKDALSSSSDAVEGYVRQWIDSEEVSEEEGRAIRDRFSWYTDLAEAVSGAGIVIEAIVERLDVKRDVFKALDELCSEDTVIATNSSSIRVSKIEGATTHPERVLNMHFYGHPWRNRIVELMRGTATTDEAMGVAAGFCRSIGVTPLIVRRESTGFIYNRVWRAIKKECLTVVDQGVASYEDVDRAWMSLYGAGIGPFGMMDRVGLDVVRDIEMVYYGESGDPRDAPPEVLLDKVRRGELGVKTGKGFYTYPDPCYMDPGWLHGEG